MTPYMVSFRVISNSIFYNEAGFVISVTEVKTASTANTHTLIETLQLLTVLRTESY